MSEERISSAQNQWFKQLLKLRESRERKAKGWTRIDGARELSRAIDARLDVEILMICPERLRDDESRRIVETAERSSRPALLLEEGLYDQLRYGDRDEGICAAVSWSPGRLDDFEPGDAPLLLVLEAVEKPGNLGAIMRTADAAGASAVILCESAIDPSNPNAVRSSLGTLFTVPVLLSSSEAAVEWLAVRKIQTLAAVVDADLDYTDCDLRCASALAFGSEHDGLSAIWRGDTTTGIRIPMHGHADSLNVSVAVGVVLYEALRQRIH